MFKKKKLLKIFIFRATGIALKLTLTSYQHSLYISFCLPALLSTLPPPPLPPPEELQCFRLLQTGRTAVQPPSLQVPEQIKLTSNRHHTGPQSMKCCFLLNIFKVILLKLVLCVSSLCSSAVWLATCGPCLWVQGGGTARGP